MIIMLAIAAVQIAYFYPELPNVMAVHFGVSGAPDSWQPKSSFFGLFCLVYAIFAGLYWTMPQLIMSLPPGLINLPNKAYWLAPERRAITAHLVADQLAWFGAAQILFVIAVCQLAINANLPGSTGVLSRAIWWVVAIFLAFAALWTIRFYRTFCRATT